MVSISKVADKRYNVTKHDYEITFNADAQVQPCGEDGSIDTTLPADYIDLKALKNRPLPKNVPGQPNKGIIVDLIGVITEVTPATENTQIVAKSGP